VTISAFRSYWGRRGLAVPATGWAKVKTVVQAVAVGLALLPPVADDALWLASSVLWLAAALTLLTGAHYLVAGSRATAAGGARV
jgi:phosphatidylglycerophosphate synthase